MQNAYNFTVLLLLLIIGIAIRIAFANLSISIDATSFPLWARYLSEHSIGELYANLPGKYPPYLPGYYFLLKPMGWLHQVLGLEKNALFTYLFFKSPVFLADIASTLLIFSLTRKFYSQKAALWGASFFFLNPAVIFVSSIWGQIDSFVILFSLLFITTFLTKKLSLSLLAITIGSLIKFQQLAVVPLLLAIPFLYKANRILKALAISVLFALMIFSPVFFYKGPLWGLKYLLSLPHQYPYLSVYAYNIWSPLGFIRSDTTPVFFILTYNLSGLLLYGSISAYVVFKLYAAKKYFSKAIIFAALLLFFSFAFFSTRIHGRYFIYTIGMAAPFFYKKPKQILLLNVFVILNLLLPGDYQQIKKIAQILQADNVIILLTAIGLMIFITLLTSYLNILKAE